MNTLPRVVSSVALFAIVSCGGGGGGGGGTPPSPTGGTGGTGGSGGGGSVTEEPGSLDHCQPSSGIFSNVTEALGLCYEVPGDDTATEIEELGGGLALADIDQDGRLDLYVAYGQQKIGELFGFDGTRFNKRESSGIVPSSMDIAGYFVDVDGDGFKDFVSAQEAGVEVFINEGNGRFVPGDDATNIDNERATFSMAAGDYDLDGDLDLFFAHWGTGYIGGQQEYLWENKGGGRYLDVSYRVPVASAISGNRLESEYSFTPIFADFDDDGDPDLLMANDFESSQVLMNAFGGNLFLDLTSDEISDENGMGNAVTDYDRDGDLDWFVTSIWDPDVERNGSGNRLYQNADGFGAFVDVTEEAGVREGHWGWGACFADFDNDGYMDIFHTNGHREQGRSQFRTDPSVLFMSNGDGTFTERATELGVVHTDQGRGVVCADYDNDGWVDIFIANNGKSPTVFRNDHDNGNHYIAIDLAGLDGNPEAIGAKVRVTSASGTQFQEAQLGNGYLSHGPATLHFGLGEDDHITAVDVVWPGPGGHASRVEGLSIDRKVSIRHPLDGG
ncbi:MAG: CRTAC1 family protein [Gammaproteobacteria bacterium]|nr:CRTAC1 family protein [Gammaproteobacteria bacterium]